MYTLRFATFFFGTMAKLNRKKEKKKKNNKRIKHEEQGSSMNHRGE